MICRRNRIRGKAAQKKLAELVEGKDVGTLGGEDVFHPDFSFEQKNLARAAVFKIMEQAVANAARAKKTGREKKDRTPVVVIKLKGKHLEASGLVVMRFKDFMKHIMGKEEL